MKRFKKLLMLGMILSLLCLTATGCGEMTAEKLAGKMNGAAEGKQITCADMEMELEASYAMNLMGMDMSTDMAMDMDLGMQFNAEPFAGYTEGHLKMTLMDQEIDTDIKAHTVIEDDEIVTYGYTGMTDTWSRQDTGLGASEYEQLLLTAPVEEYDASEFELEEETADLDGSEVYVLHLSYTGEEMEMILSEMGSFSGMSGIDEGSMSDITVPATVYVDAQTFLPVRIEMDIEGMENLVNNMLEQEIQNLGEYAQGAEISVEVGKCHAVMKNFGYDVQQIPEVPQEARDSIALAEALENAGTTLPDGRYLLKYEGSALALSELDGYIIEGVSGANAELYSENGLQMIAMAGMPAGMTDAALEETVSSYEAMFTSMGITMETIDTPETVTTQFGDVTVTQMEGSGLNLYYTTIPAGSMEMLIMAIDMNGEWQQAADIIVPAAGALSEVTLEDLQ